MDPCALKMILGIIPLPQNSINHVSFHTYLQLGSKCAFSKNFWAGEPLIRAWKRMTQATVGENLGTLMNIKVVFQF